MKKLAIFTFAALLAGIFAMPAAAVEHEFGGYWNTRFFMARDFSGSSEGANDEAADYSLVDSRTRLYYTAVLNDALKLVTKFEMDADWGDGGTEFGDIGADGIAVEVKNTYAEVDYGMTRTRIGTQGAAIARSFLFDADFSGITLNVMPSDTMQIPLYWIRIDEGGVGKDQNDGDADMFGVSPFFSFGGVSVNPMLFWLTSEDASLGDELGGFNTNGTEKLNFYYLGVNVDASFGPGNVWFTGIYQGGTAEAAVGDDLNVSAFLAALGGGANFGKFEAHGQIFYASGDDENDDDLTDFTAPPGQSYYWAEIMGFGTFDDAVSNGSPGDAISDILAIGIGGSFSPMEKLSLGLDIWYAQLAVDEQDGADVDNDLGTEFDFTVKYALIENLDLKVVAAYLLAGEGTDPTADNDDTANPFELGAQLSLSF